MKASTDSEAFIASMEAFMEAVEASVEETSMKVLRGTFHGSYFHGSFRESFHGSVLIAPLVSPERDTHIVDGRKTIGPRTP